LHAHALQLATTVGNKKKKRRTIRESKRK